jgi:hypothetical protein
LLLLSAVDTFDLLRGAALSTLLLSLPAWANAGGAPSAAQIAAHEAGLRDSLQLKGHLAKAHADPLHSAIVKHRATFGGARAIKLATAAGKTLEIANGQLQVNGAGATLADLHAVGIMNKSALDATIRVKLKTYLEREGFKEGADASDAVLQAKVEEQVRTADGLYTQLVAHADLALLANHHAHVSQRTGQPTFELAHPGDIKIEADTGRQVTHDTEGTKLPVGYGTLRTLGYDSPEKWQGLLERTLLKRAGIAGEPTADSVAAARKKLGEDITEVQQLNTWISHVTSNQKYLLLNQLMGTTNRRDIILGQHGTEELHFNGSQLYVMSNGRVHAVSFITLVNFGMDTRANFDAVADRALLTFPLDLSK